MTDWLGVRHRVSAGLQSSDLPSPNYCDLQLEPALKLLSPSPLRLAHFVPVHLVEGGISRGVGDCPV